MSNLPPTNEIAETAFIGAMLIDPSNIQDATLQADELHNRDLAALWVKMRKLSADGRQIDVVTLAGENKHQQSLVVSLLSRVPNTTHWPEYEAEVRKAAFCRKILQTASELARQAYSGDPDPGEIAGMVDKLTRETPGKVSLKRLGQVAYETISQIEERAKDPKAVWGIPTGFLDLDEILGGWHKKQVVILAGEPGIGKSRVLVQSMTHAAKLGHACILYSAEMSEEELGTRIISTEAEIRTRSIETGQLSGDDWQGIYSTLESLDAPNLFINDHAAPTLDMIQRGVVEMRHKGTPVDMIGVDYIWLVAQAIKTRNMDDDTATNVVVAGLKRIAKTEDVAVLAISSVTKAGMDTGGKDTKMGNLRGGGQQIHDAHNVIFLTQADNDPKVIIGQFMKGRHLRLRRLEFVLLNDPKGTPKLLPGISRKQKLEY